MLSSLKLYQAIQAAWPLEAWQDDVVVLAVSGGADSSALLDALMTLRPNPTKTVVAHFNHGLRGAESDNDQSFVNELCQRFGLVFECGVASESQRLSSSEDSLRKLRRRFLIETAESHKASWIALAHHADDQVETFLHNLLRGSGPRGLSGMKTIRSVTDSIRMVRPLLKSHRSEIITYLNERNLSYRIDASNATSDYTRNRIRHELIPTLRTFTGNETVDRNLFRACTLIAQEHEEIEHRAQAWLTELDGFPNSVASPNEVAIQIGKLADVSWPVLCEAFTILWNRFQWPLREMSTEHWNRLESFIRAAQSTPHPKRLELPGGIVASYRQRIFSLHRQPASPTSSG